MIRRTSRAARAAAFLLGGAFLAGCGATVSEQPGGIADYERGKRAYDQENWLDASLDLKAFVEAYPGTERTDDALYYLGDAYFRMKDYALASGQFDRLLRDFPASVHEADASFLLARCDDLQSHPAKLDQTETERAITRYRAFLEAHPDHPRAAEARTRLLALRTKLAEKRYLNGKLYKKLKHIDAAERYYKSVMSDYSDTKWAADAALGLAEMLLEQGFPPGESLDILKAIPPGLATPETQHKIDDRLRKLEAREGSK
ncbi:MAG TPA: outer membrane protein assembly factor BamD [Candidatus Eisenbacteria bacterium]|nr:outer membrane protein assembly factor BamD [Candidatus Eisenbacteria bacterium]